MRRNRRRPVDEGYLNWRKSVLKRDKHTCQMPGCRRRKTLEIHHIRTYAKNPTIRTDVNNGITLCRECHKSIRLYEDVYAPLFDNIIRDKRK